MREENNTASLVSSWREAMGTILISDWEIIEDEDGAPVEIVWSGASHLRVCFPVSDSPKVTEFIRRCSPSGISALLDAIESTSRALSEKEAAERAFFAEFGQWKELGWRTASEKLNALLDAADGADRDAETATRQRDEALAALKASEERGGRLSSELASARLRPEPSNGSALEWSVKRLQWKDGRTAETVFSVVQIAKILGSEQLVGLEYMILGPDRHGLYEVVLGSKIIASRGSEDEAKSAAQQDYEQRIHCCLDLENGPATLADATQKDLGTEQREAGV